MSNLSIQVWELFKKSLLIYMRNKKAAIKELFMPIVTALAIYANSRSTSLFLPIQVLFPISLIGHVRNLMVDVVADKSEKYKEYLKINGVSQMGYLLGVLVYAYFKCIIYTIITCSGFIFASEYSTQAYPVWDFIWLYFAVSIATTHFALFCTVFFYNKQLCSDIGGFVYSVLSFLYYGALENNSKPWFYFSLFFPQNILSYALNPYQLLQVPNDLPLENSLFYKFIVLDCVLYLLLYLYLDQVFPDSSGIKKKWHFPFEYCLSRKKRQTDNLNLGESSSFVQYEGMISDQNTLRIGLNDGDDASSAIHHENFENPFSYKRSVIVEKLNKSFGNEKIITDLSMMIYEKQIFCLLGHNGAGKTTTINILTGLIDYESGEIFYFDQPFRKNLDKIRRNVGLCGQQDILYQDLTVKEHLKLFAKLRGHPSDQLEEEVFSVMMKMGLDTQGDVPAKNLSGGNQRKLSLGLAIVGGSSVIFLDEPTSGMDPTTRRMIWDAIKQLRHDGKTILLTTHHLDEADELADRIAIMSKGRLFAVGTGEFIKKKFGVGYQLIITPNYDTSNLAEFMKSKEKLIEIVSEFIEDAGKGDQKNNEQLRFVLPFTHQQKFANLFEALEVVPGIRLNLQMNSLEDAFINIGMQEESIFENGYDINSRIEINNQLPRAMKNQPRFNFIYQLEAMFLRKYFVTMRDFNNVILIILPIVFVALGTLFTTSKIEDINEENSEYQPNQEAIDTVKTFMFLFLVNFAYALNTTIYAAFSVYEREHKIKYILNVMGIRALPYWLGTFIFDFLVISSINIILLVLVYVFEIEKLMSQIYLFAGIIVPYSVALLTSSYLWGFIFQKSVTVYKSFAAFYFFVLYVLVQILTTILQVMGTQSSANVLKFVGFNLCPMFAFNEAVTYFVFSDIVPNLNESFNLMLSSPTQCIYFLWWVGILSMGLTLICEKRYFKISVDPLRALDTNTNFEGVSDPQEIISEALRVQEAVSDNIRISHIKKIYPNGFQAVQDISFGVSPGQIFGLLGPNGAGKSTTFNMATAMIPRTGGSIHLRQVSIDDELLQVFTDTGICPQFNPLWEDMKVDEHLFIIAKVKGIARDEAWDCMQFVMNTLNLTEFAKKKSKILSGGTKRRLCAAMAIIGAPTIQFLDEPSTGLDPMAKRHLWNLISNVSNTRKASVVLTTHSMEEAEALCNKIGIIINGKFVCIGPLNYLKNKYGSGYKVTLIKNKPEDDVSDLVASLFPTAEKVQENQILNTTYQISNDHFVFSKAFRALEDLKRKKMLQDFSIYNTTLEQVFINFSKRQAEPLNLVGNGPNGYTFVA